jgi:hypothetical protein
LKIGPRRRRCIASVVRSGPQLRRAETFKLSSDPLFVEKVRDIVGLWLRMKRISESEH